MTCPHVPNDLSRIQLIFIRITSCCKSKKRSQRGWYTITTFQSRWTNERNERSVCLLKLFFIFCPFVNADGLSRQSRPRHRFDNKRETVYSIANKSIYFQTITLLFVGTKYPVTVLPGRNVNKIRCFVSQKVNLMLFYYC